MSALATNQLMEGCKMISGKVFAYKLMSVAGDLPR